MDTTRQAQPPSPNTTTTLTVQRHPRLIFGLRVLWVVVCLTTVILLVVSLVRLNEVARQPCVNEPCYIFQLTSEELAVLEAAGLSIDFIIAVATIYHVMLITIYSVIGALLMMRQAFDVNGVVYALACPAWIIAYLSAFALLTDPPWFFLRALLYSIGLPISLLFIFMFPDGKFFPAWTRWVAIGLGLVMFITAFLPDPHIWLELFAFFDEREINVFPGLLFMGLCFFALFIQYWRFRTVQTSAQRRQSKWVVFAFSPQLLGTVLAIVLLTLIDHTTLIPPAAIPWLLAISPIGVLIAIGITPFVILASIVRFRLWSIDLALNRALVMTSVATMLAVIFALSFGVIQGILNLFLDGEVAGIALAAAAGITLLVFRRTAYGVRRFIDIHIYGLRFDLNQLEAAQRRPTIANPGTLSGRTVGSFTLLDLIGKGGMGEVYLAQHQQNDKRAAIKVLQLDSISDAAAEDSRARFRHEAQALARLDHPNIVKIFDAGTEDGIRYIVMEYIDGMDVRNLLTAHKRLPLSDVLRITDEISMALDYVHAKQLVHRDIKPSNIMVRHVQDTQANGGAVLMDFGIAKLEDSLTQLTGSSSVIGTITYMSPEQIMSSAQVNYRSDIYSLGVVVYEMLTGAVPFDGSAGVVMFAHLQEPPPDPRRIVPDLPVGIAAALKKAMEKDSAARHVSAGAFAADLRSAVSEQTTDLQSEEPPLIIPPNWIDDLPTAALS